MEVEILGDSFLDDDRSLVDIFFDSGLREVDRHASSDGLFEFKQLFMSVLVCQFW